MIPLDISNNRAINNIASTITHHLNGETYRNGLMICPNQLTFKMCGPNNKEICNEDSKSGNNNVGIGLIGGYDFS
jgi:hypothetical protein